MDINSLTDDIVDYIFLLKRDYDLQVSFDYSLVRLPTDTRLGLVLHDNPYCNCIKKYGHKFCKQCKHCILRGKTDAPYFGTCYAGVGEYVFPVTDGDKRTNFINVSGYRRETSAVDFDRLSRIVKQPAPLLKKRYTSLNADVPELDAIYPLIRPLVHMITILQNISRARPDPPLDRSAAIYNDILKYVTENHKSDLSIADVCDYTHYSQSYIFALFKRYNGASPVEYVTKLKMESAALLLRDTDMKILDIAYDVGYNDSNYFTTSFKAHYGVSPREYRKQNRRSLR